MAEIPIVINKKSPLQRIMINPINSLPIYYSKEILSPTSDDFTDRLKSSELNLLNGIFNVFDSLGADNFGVFLVGSCVDAIKGGFHRRPNDYDLLFVPNLASNSDERLDYLLKLESSMNSFLNSMSEESKLSYYQFLGLNWRTIDINKSVSSRYYSDKNRYDIRFIIQPNKGKKFDVSIAGHDRGDISQVEDMLLEKHEPFIRIR